MGCREGLGIRVCQKISLSFVPLPTGRLHRTGSEAAALFFSKPVRKKSISVILAGLANLPSRGAVRNLCLTCGKNSEATDAACKPLLQRKYVGISKCKLERRNLVLSKYSCPTYLFSIKRNIDFKTVLGCNL